MITNAHRFHELGSLRFAYTKGKTVRSTDIGLRYIENTRRSTWRAAVVVSKKVHKSAVKRNKIRRRIYEVVRLAGIPETQTADLVFTVYTDAVLGMPPTELTAIIQKLLSQAGVTK